MTITTAREYLTSKERELTGLLRDARSYKALGLPSYRGFARSAIKLHRTMQVYRRALRDMEASANVGR